ncbi:MAG: tRNA (guanosine(46)-N7)-methyltransferase TrmB [bacterium]
MDNFIPWLPNDDLLRVFDWREVFGNERPVEVDLGAGDGGFVLAQATRRPEINYVAVERLLGRARKIAKRAVREERTNLRVLRLESFYFLRWMCPPASLQTIHIMFPDPWPKRKHFARRLIQPDFIETARRALVADGAVKFTTDHTDYFEWTRRLWNGASGWKALGAWDAEEEPRSDFQKTFDSEGRATCRAAWQKEADAP